MNVDIDILVVSAHLHNTHQNNIYSFHLIITELLLISRILRKMYK